MYLTFYGLREKPFGATPDPRFLYFTASHQEALAQLTFSVQDSRGVLVLTGEVGTGKTTLVRELLQRLDAANTEVHNLDKNLSTITGTAATFIFNSSLSFDGILEYMLHDLGVPSGGDSRAQRLLSLNHFLIERRRLGHRTVVIFDEAQNFDVATLEQIRLLSNFETTQDKLLQVLLIGQPELDAKLQRPDLRQLRERVELRYRISPLSREETHAYIRTRLRVAGASDLGLFSDRAVARIAAYAKGIPRRINTVCDHCLVIGYADQRRRIEPDIVGQAIDAIATPAPSSWRLVDRPALRLTWVVGVCAAALLGGIAVFPSRFEPSYLINLARVAREFLLP